MDEEKENRDEEQAEEIEEVSASSDSFIDDADDMNDDVSHPEASLMYYVKLSYSSNRISPHSI